MSFFESFQESKDFSPPFTSGCRLGWRWQFANGEIDTNRIPGVLLINTIGKDIMITNKPCYHMYGIKDAKTNTYERIGTGSITNATGGTVDVSAYEVVGLKYNDADFSVELSNEVPPILATSQSSSFVGDEDFEHTVSDRATWVGDDISGLEQDDIPYLKMVIRGSGGLTGTLSFTPDNPYNGRTEYTIYSDGYFYVKVSGLYPAFSSLKVTYRMSSMAGFEISSTFSNRPIT